MNIDIQDIIAQSYIEDWGPSVAYMVKLTSDVSTAEEYVQTAFEVALKKWPDEIPQNKGAWIRQVAKNRFIDNVRGIKTRAEAEDAIQKVEEISREPHEDSVLDDELSLMFLCCHPAISPTDQVILVLRLIGGLKPFEIGKAFDQHEEAIRSRLLRAKRKMKAAKISTTMPRDEDLSSRIRQVLAAIYLIYNEGYRAARNSVQERKDLTLEAIRLAARFCRYMPNLAEAYGLMALILLGEARRPARFIKGALIPLEMQDRDLWDRDLIKAGLAHVQNAQKINLSNNADPGIYLLQARIAANHSTSAKFAATNWQDIANCYEQLLTLHNSPLFALNHIVAQSFIDDAPESLKALDAWEVEHDKTAQNHALRADILRRAGEVKSAISYYEKAIVLETDEGVRRFWQSRIDELLRF
ncbi:MAG: sigma-70 family RNA polymerase sigma factor [Rhizobiaceae bacterium]|nr:sigma-70 family RNA polymerase sigma factor [Rhizobiaceae bacterium]